MGCGGGRVVINEVVRNNLVNTYTEDLKSSFRNYLRNLPFYSMNIQKLQNVIDGFRREDKISIEDYVTTLKIDKLEKATLIELLTNASQRLKNIFPEDKFENLLLRFTILFLANPTKKDILDEKKTLINEVISYTQDKSEFIKFRSGQFSFMIVNIIYLFCNIMNYCLLSVVLLQVFDKVGLGDIEKILLDKISIKNIDPNKMQEYYNKKLTLINPRLKTAEPIVDTCLPYVFEPIKDIVNHQADVECVIIPQEEMADIVKRLLIIFDPFMFLEVFLTLRIRDY